MDKLLERNRHNIDEVLCGNLEFQTNFVEDITRYPILRLESWKYLQTVGNKASDYNMISLLNGLIKGSATSFQDNDLHSSIILSVIPPQKALKLLLFDFHHHNHSKRLRLGWLESLFLINVILSEKNYESLKMNNNESNDTDCTSRNEVDVDISQWSCFLFRIIDEQSQIFFSQKKTNNTSLAQNHISDHLWLYELVCSLKRQLIELQDSIDHAIFIIDSSSLKQLLEICLFIIKSITSSQALASHLPISIYDQNHEEFPNWLFDNSQPLSVSKELVVVEGEDFEESKKEEIDAMFAKFRTFDLKLKDGQLHTSSEWCEFKEQVLEAFLSPPWHLQTFNHTHSLVFLTSELVKDVCSRLDLSLDIVTKQLWDFVARIMIEQLGGIETVISQVQASIQIEYAISYGPPSCLRPYFTLCLAIMKRVVVSAISNCELRNHLADITTSSSSSGSANIATTNCDLNPDLTCPVNYRWTLCVWQTVANILVLAEHVECEDKIECENDVELFMNWSMVYVSKYQQVDSIRSFVIERLSPFKIFSTDKNFNSSSFSSSHDYQNTLKSISYWCAWLFLGRICLSFDFGDDIGTKKSLYSNKVNLKFKYLSCRVYQKSLWNWCVTSKDLFHGVLILFSNNINNNSFIDDDNNSSECEVEMKNIYMKKHLIPTILKMIYLFFFKDLKQTSISYRQLMTSVISQLLTYLRKDGWMIIPSTFLISRFKHIFLRTMTCFGFLNPKLLRNNLDDTSWIPMHDKLDLILYYLLQSKQDHHKQTPLELWYEETVVSACLTKNATLSLILDRMLWEPKAVTLLTLKGFQKAYTNKYPHSSSSSSSLSSSSSSSVSNSLIDKNSFNELRLAELIQSTEAALSNSLLPLPCHPPQQRPSHLGQRLVLSQAWSTGKKENACSGLNDEILALFGSSNQEEAREKAQNCYSLVLMQQVAVIFSMNSSASSLDSSSLSCLSSPSMTQHLFSTPALIEYLLKPSSVHALLSSTISTSSCEVERNSSIPSQAQLQLQRLRLLASLQFEAKFLNRGDLIEDTLHLLESLESPPVSLTLVARSEVPISTLELELKLKHFTTEAKSGRITPNLNSVVCSLFNSIVLETSLQHSSKNRFKNHKNKNKLNSHSTQQFEDLLTLFATYKDWLPASAAIDCFGDMMLTIPYPKKELSNLQLDGEENDWIPPVLLNGFRLCNSLVPCALEWSLLFKNNLLENSILTELLSYQCLTSSSSSVTSLGFRYENWLHSLQFLSYISNSKSSSLHSQFVHPDSLFQGIQSCLSVAVVTFFYLSLNQHHSNNKHHHHFNPSCLVRIYNQLWCSKYFESIKKEQNNETTVTVEYSTEFLIVSLESRECFLIVKNQGVNQQWTRKQNFARDRNNDAEIDDDRLKVVMSELGYSSSIKFAVLLKFDSFIWLLLQPPPPPSPTTASSALSSHQIEPVKGLVLDKQPDWFYNMLFLYVITQFAGSWNLMLSEAISIFFGYNHGFLNSELAEQYLFKMIEIHIMDHDNGHNNDDIDGSGDDDDGGGGNNVFHILASLETVTMTCSDDNFYHMLHCWELMFAEVKLSSLAMCPIHFVKQFHSLLHRNSLTILFNQIKTKGYRVVEYLISIIKLMRNHYTKKIKTNLDDEDLIHTCLDIQSKLMVSILIWVEFTTCVISIIQDKFKQNKHVESDDDNFEDIELGLIKFQNDCFLKLNDIIFSKQDVHHQINLTLESLKVRRLLKVYGYRKTLQKWDQLVSGDLFNQPSIEKLAHVEEQEQETTNTLEQFPMDSNNKFKDVAFPDLMPSSPKPTLVSGGSYPLSSPSLHGSSSKKRSRTIDNEDLPSFMASI